MFGIIRPPRRPPDWQPPGPPPATPLDRPDLAPRPGEDLCYLTGDWRILQRVDGHRWSLDDLVTAWVAADETRDSPPTRIADLGCGIGAVLLMLAWRFPHASGLGVEAQDVSVDLARRSVAWNGAADRCEMRSGDFRSSAVLSASQDFDLVTGTPPYLPRGSAPESSRIQWGACHFEHRGGVEEYCAAAARILAPAGRFVTCAGALQAGRVESGATAVGLAISRRLDVIPRAGKAPLFSVYAMSPWRTAAGPHKQSRLVVRDARGARTEQFRALRADMGMPP